MNFGSLEKIESIILRPAKNFIIKNVVIFGSRDSVGFRIDALKDRTYKSNKYSNTDYVGRLSLETSDYLVFEFSNTINDKRKTEEIFISYPHIYEFKEILEEIYTEYANNDVFKYNKNNIPYLTEEYKEYLKKIELINNKNIGFMFDVLEEYDDVAHVTNYSEGITIIFNDEELYSTVSMDTFYYIYRFVNEFNLLQSSQNLINLSYMTEMSKSLNLTNEITKEIKHGHVVGRSIKSRSEIEKSKEEKLEEFVKTNDELPEEVPFDEFFIKHVI